MSKDIEKLYPLQNKETLKQGFFYSTEFKGELKELYFCIWPKNSFKDRAPLFIRKDKQQDSYQLLLKSEEASFLSIARKEGVTLKFYKTTSKLDKEGFPLNGRRGIRFDVTTKKIENATHSLVFNINKENGNSNLFEMLQTIYESNKKQKEISLQDYLEKNSFKLDGEYPFRIFLRIEFEKRTISFKNSKEEIYFFGSPSLPKKEFISETLFYKAQKESCSSDKTPKEGLRKTEELLVPGCQEFKKKLEFFSLSEGWIESSPEGKAVFMAHFEQIKRKHELSYYHTLFHLFTCNTCLNKAPEILKPKSHSRLWELALKEPLANFILLNQLQESSDENKPQVYYFGLFYEKLFEASLRSDLLAFISQQKKLKEIPTDWTTMRELLEEGPKILADFLMVCYSKPLCKAFKKYKPKLDELQISELASEVLYEFLKNDFQSVKQLDFQNGHLRKLFSKIIQSKLSQREKAKSNEESLKCCLKREAQAPCLNVCVDISIDIHEALKLLEKNKPQFYKPILYHHLKGNTIPETSKKLNLTESTIKSYLFHGRRYLMNVLEPYHDL